MIFGGDAKDPEVVMPAPENSQDQHNTREHQRSRQLIEGIVDERLVPVSDQLRFLSENSMEGCEKPHSYCSDYMDAHLWLAQYDDYAKSKNFTDEKYISSFSSHLNQKGQRWFYNLSSDEKNSADKVRSAFLERFQPSKYVSKDSFFDRRQGICEPVEDYIDEKIHLFNRTEVDEDTAVWHTVEQLQPNIRQYVYDKLQDKTFKSLRQHARMAASVAKSKTTVASTLCHNCAQSSGVSASPETSINATAPKQYTQHTAPQPRQSTRQQNWRPQNNRRQQHIPGAYSSSSYQRTPGPSKDYNSCTSCGGPHNRSQCEVFQRQVVCRYCHKPGHITKVCRTRLRQQNSQQ